MFFSEPGETWEYTNLPSYKNTSRKNKEYDSSENSFWAKLILDSVFLEWNVTVHLLIFCKSNAMK